MRTRPRAGGGSKGKAKEIGRPQWGKVDQAGQEASAAASNRGAPQGYANTYIPRGWRALIERARRHNVGSMTAAYVTSCRRQRSHCATWTPHGFGWDAGSRFARGRASGAGGMCRVACKRQEAQRGWQGCTAVFQEQGQNCNDLAAYDTAHVRRVHCGCSPAVSWKTAMHPVRGQALSYRLQATGTGRGLSETRDARKGNLYLDAAWFRVGRGVSLCERARKSVGNAPKDSSSQSRKGLVKGSDMLGKRIEPHAGCKGAPMFSKSKGKTAMISPPMYRTRTASSLQLQSRSFWKTSAHPMGWNCALHLLAKHARPRWCGSVAIGCLGLTGAGARTASEQRRAQIGSAEIGSEPHPRDPQR